MDTRAFLTLLVAILVLGGGIGGAFVGGIALGNSREAEAAQNGVLAQSTSSLALQSPRRSDAPSLDQLSQQFRSGRLGQDFGGRGGLSGTIEKIEGNTITVNTPRGPLQATVVADTTIQMFAEGTLANLLEGVQVTVFGLPGEDGTVQATSILLVPEGGAGLFDEGSFFGDRQQRNQTPGGAGGIPSGE